MKNSNDSKARNTNRATKKRDAAIEAIARNILEIETLAERRVNTGQLCSRFCDAMARRGAQVWPPEYRPITNGWDVVPAITTP